ncbi:MAG TPA: hypothetical protein VNE42_09490 [Acidimicrobiales bacterium]|nr:hypothetical protein [Acidimicrobiales bacterium]
MTTSVVLFIAAFFACSVEAVEATTVVLAVGLTRSWKSTRRGVFAAVAVLVAIVAALGPAIAHLPLSPLRLVVGGLLLIFGLGWLRKAILRASGYKALHDEAAAYATLTAEAQGLNNASGVSSGADARQQSGAGWMGGDAYSFTLAFKSVLLEGMEVAFIVVTFGANAHNLGLASIAAAAAIALIVSVAFVVRGPLSKVPENTIKFSVGVLLASFGTFWGAEGAGATWPHSDASLLVLIPAIALMALGTVGVLRNYRQSNEKSSLTPVVTS